MLRDESDRDSASNRALVGTSLSGSLCGSAVAGPSGLYNRSALTIMSAYDLFFSVRLNKISILNTNC